MPRTTPMRLAVVVLVVCLGVTVWVPWSGHATPDVSSTSLVSSHVQLSLPGVTASSQRSADVLRAACAPACQVSRGPPRAAPSAKPLTAVSPTGTNHLVANFSGEGMIVINPANPLNLVAGSLYQEPSALNNTTVFSQLGVSGAFASFDGGKSWLDQPLPQLPQYNNDSSPECGHIHLADSVLTFGPNDTVYYGDLSYYPISLGRCSAALAGTGFYVTISHDGGLTWGTPTAVAGDNGGASIDKPWIAVNPHSGIVYVAYTDDGNGSQIYLQRSVNNGTTWSAPKLISSGSGEDRGVELAVDPWGGLDATWVDQGTAALWFTRSVDNGTSFTTPKILATGLSEFGNPSPDAFRAYMLPGMGVDSNPLSPYAGRIYVTWQNGTGAAAGVPTLGFSWSANNGSTWTTTGAVDPSNAMVFQPDVAAGPDGTVYLEWYGVNHTTGIYRLYGLVSGDGGVTFSPAFPVSDVNSYPQFNSAGGGNAWWIGDYSDAASSPLGAWTLWTDARGTAAYSCTTCLWGYDYNISMMAAEMSRVSLTSNVPVNVTLNDTLANSTSVPANLNRTLVPVLIGENYSLTVPATTTFNGSEWYFAAWFGSLSSNSTNLSGTVSGPENLHACYTSAPGATCMAPGAPGWLFIQASPVTAHVTVNGTAVALNGSGEVTLLEPPIGFNITASAPNYFAQAVTEQVSPGRVTDVRLNLSPIAGTLRGTVSPTGAYLSLSPGGSVTVDATGRFSTLLAPGGYQWTATAPNYYSATAVITIAANQTTWLNITLVPFGTVIGVVSPAGAHVTLNGVGVPLDPTGGFTDQVPTGTYWLNATAPNYNSGSFGPFVVNSGKVTHVTLPLVPLNGLLVATVSPANALVSVDQQSVALVGGRFNLSEVPGLYNVSVSAHDYFPWTEDIAIGPNETVTLSIGLNLSVGWLTGAVSPSSASATVDGQNLPISPSGSFNVSLAPGSYALEFSAPGYFSESRNVTVQIAHATAVPVSLAPQPAAGFFSLGGPGIYLAVGLVVLLAVAIYAMFVLRRKKVAPGHSPMVPKPRPPRSG